MGQKAVWEEGSGQGKKGKGDGQHCDQLGREREEKEQ